MSLNKKKVVATLFVVLATLHVAVPLQMIGKREWVLRHGSVHRFETAPVDPVDLFRGRYVQLRMKESTATCENKNNFSDGQRLYVSVTKDENGISHLGVASLKRPATGDYFRAAIQNRYGRADTVRVKLPYDRYYMNEKLAPEAERVYRDFARSDSGKSATVTVRMAHGVAVLEELYVEDKTIYEFMT